MIENSEINTNSIFDNNFPKNTKIINEIIELTKEYKKFSSEEIKEKIIKVLKDSGIEPELIKNEEKETLAHIIIREDKYDRVVPVIEAYMNLLGITDTFFDWLLCENNEKLTSLDICAKNGNKEIIKYMYSIISKTTENKFRITEKRMGIFHYAAMYNQCFSIIYFNEKLQKFFKKTTIIDVPSEYGKTPLHSACIRGSRNAVDLLLDLGANINATDIEGNSCLHFVVEKNNVHLLKKLLVRGADKTMRNKEGKLPLDLAKERRNNEMIEVLSAKGSFFQNPCKTNQEITGLRSSHNNITLFVLILFMGVGKWIYLSRLYWVYENNFKLDVIPFVYEIEAVKELCYKGNYRTYSNCTIDDTLIKNYVAMTGHIKPTIDSITQLFEESTYGYDYLESFYNLGWFFSFFEVIMLFFILKFMCFSGYIFEKKKTYRKQPSLIKLFESYNNICVKCRTEKKHSTVHCIVCNGCVRDFDHHCSWLNICISKENLCWFRAFLYFFLLYVLVNLLFFGYSK